MHGQINIIIIDNFDDYHIHIAGDYHAALLTRQSGPKLMLGRGGFVLLAD